MTDYLTSTIPTYKMADEIFESRISRMFFGGFSSAAALFITHPLDVIKLNLQVKALTVSELVTYYFVTDKGGIRRIYKGTAGSMARAMVYSNLRFELYELARRRNLLNSFHEKVAIASVSGGIGGFFVTPMSKVHVRTQNDELLPPNERRYYKGLFHGLQRIYREEGVRMMFAGSAISCLRGMMCTIGQLALYDEAKVQLIAFPGYFGDDFKTYLISSVAAGFVATLLQQPFEVINTQLMTAPPGKFRNTVDVIRETVRQYGVIGFYKGLVPGLVRIVTQTVITYMILESLRGHFGVLLSQRRRGDLIEIINADDVDGESCGQQEVPHVVSSGETVQ